MMHQIIPQSYFSLTHPFPFTKGWTASDFSSVIPSLDRNDEPYLDQLPLSPVLVKRATITNAVDAGTVLTSRTLRLSVAAYRPFVLTGNERLPPDLPINELLGEWNRELAHPPEQRSREWLLALSTAIAVHPRCPRRLAKQWLSDGLHVELIFQNPSFPLDWLAKNSSIEVFERGIASASRLFTGPERIRTLRHLVRSRKMTKNILRFFYPEPHFVEVTTINREFYDIHEHCDPKRVLAPRCILLQLQHPLKDQKTHVREALILGRLLDEDDFSGLPQFPRGLLSRACL